MNKITMTTPLYGGLNVLTDQPLSAVEVWKRYCLLSNGKLPVRRYAYMDGENLIKGWNVKFYYDGEEVSEDFIVPLNNTEYFQVIGNIDVDNPFPEFSNEIYY